jgi:hypothetical protein
MLGHMSSVWMQEIAGLLFLRFASKLSLLGMRVTPSCIAYLVLVFAQSYYRELGIMRKRSINP